MVYIMSQSMKVQPICFYEKGCHKCLFCTKETGQQKYWLSRKQMACYLSDTNFFDRSIFSRKDWVNCPKTMNFRIYYLKFVDFFYFPTQLLWLEAMVYLLSIKSYFSNNRPSHLSWSESPVSYQLSYQDFLVNLSFSFDSNGLEVKTRNCSKVAPFT